MWGTEKGVKIAFECHQRMNCCRASRRQLNTVDAVKEAREINNAATVRRMSLPSRWFTQHRPVAAVHRLAPLAGELPYNTARRWPRGTTAHSPSPRRSITLPVYWDMMTGQTTIKFLSMLKTFLLPCRTLPRNYDTLTMNDALWSPCRCLPTTWSALVGVLDWYSVTASIVSVYRNTSLLSLFRMSVIPLSCCVSLPMWCCCLPPEARLVSYPSQHY